MAIVQNPLEGTELEEGQQGQNANQNQGLQGQQVQKTSGEGGAIGAGAAPTQQAQPTKQGAISNRAPTSSGQFTNIQKYIQANKPAEFGKQVAGKVGGEADRASQQLGQAQQQFGTAVQGQRSQFVGGDQLQSSFQSLRDLTGTGDIRTGADDQKKVVETGISQRYTGPTQFENLNELTRQGRNLSTVANQVTNDAGQRSLLQKYYGKPQYSAGQQRLDQLLLTGEQDGALAQARQRAATFDPRLQKASGAAIAQANEASQFADTNRALAGQLAEEARTGELTELDELVKQRSAQYQKDVDAYRRNAQYNKELAGYDFGSLNQLFGTDVGTNQQFLDKYTRASNLANINRSNADPAQAALTNYFNRLVGNEDVVQNIAEATPTAAQAQYSLDPDLAGYQAQAQQLSRQYQQALREQQAAHDTFYSLGGHRTGADRDWQLSDRMNAAARNVSAAEDPLKALRQQMTGINDNSIRVGGPEAAGIDVHRSQFDYLKDIAREQAAQAAKGAQVGKKLTDRELMNKQLELAGKSYRY